jgi:hypothetical protein
MLKARPIMLAIAPALVAFACGGDDSTDVADGTGGIAGASVDGGDAAVGGAGGAGAAAGNSGNDGSAGSARDGGTGGNAGSAGRAGSDGAAGTSSDSGNGRDGTTTSDAGPDRVEDARPDRGNDAANPDAGAACTTGPAMGKTCTDYCTAWFSTCQPIAMWLSTYADPPACMSACYSWADAKLCCRMENVDNAVMAKNAKQASTYCGQAAGVAAPPECN